MLNIKLMSYGGGVSSNGK